ncbi:FAD-dependent monooxygenase [Jiangella anatolica]|uniref:FAD-dependent oxidoreductase n=1 Tax=Jiangella anatolica TaxID=2670374 RepID=A0A2W2AZR0_9ACTN|nr:FAD-dependent monooxygenase [Jiangella anatolica]PZF80621.1 FAD-dependent oxidoreductase [Jiangella anatolica]
MSDTPDVVVVGGGPAGLLLAGDLATAGVSCTLVEQRAGRSPLTRAFAVHARTLEMFDARDIAERVIDTGQRVSALSLFGSIEVDLSELPTRFPFVLVTPQYNVEDVLAGRARAAGATLRTGVTATGLDQDRDGVTVRTDQGDLRAKYAVGADGVRSTVRDALGLPFPGEAVVESVMLADVRLTTPPDDVLVANATDDGFAFVAPFGDGWYRVIAWDRKLQRPDDDPVDLAEISAVAAKVLGTDYGLHDARWLSRFHSDERLVPRYREGRVFLAGDAAHVHSPAGGQGMNTALQDSANLSWKLAAQLHGWAPSGLLDSYDTERRAVGASVVQGSGTLLRMALTGSAPLRTVRNVAGAVAASIGPVQRKAGEFVSGLAIGYTRSRGDHPLAGRRVPDVSIVTEGGTKTRLYEALRAGRFVLLTGQDHHGLVDPWAGRVDLVTTVDRSHGLTLVRPDGYVAWATDKRPMVRRDAELRAALIAWCGQPSR